jgi:aryl-alcohol dehydrogenase-like predicted oxidoreductase
MRESLHFSAAPELPTLDLLSTLLPSVSRRDFIGMIVGAMLASGLPLEAGSAQSKGEIPYHTLGRTGAKVSIIGIGGYHMGMQQDEQESIRIVRTAVDGGINFLDNCWDYNKGASEIRMGKSLRDGYRQKVFLMSKIDGRTKEAAAFQIDQSLKRLQTDYVDLMQFHEIIRMNDPDRIFAPGGAIEAMVAAQKAGKVKHIGFTGHKSPDIHLHMLDVAQKHHFQFDTVQMPLNVMDAHFNSFTEKVVPVAKKEGIAILGMKPMGDNFILQSKTVTPVECLHYAMSLPTDVVITGCDSVARVKQALEAARTFTPLSKTEMAAILAKTALAAKNGEYEKYKTSDHFDGTAHNPEYLTQAA